MTKPENTNDKPDQPESPKPPETPQDYHFRSAPAPGAKPKGEAGTPEAPPGYHLISKVNFTNETQAVVNSNIGSLPQDQQDGAIAKFVDPIVAGRLRIDGEGRTAYWGNRRLSINSHLDFTVLEALHRQFGKIVPFSDLDDRPPCKQTGIASTKPAPQNVKDAISHIRKAFEASECPLEIENCWGSGYRLWAPGK